jgi:integrase/recombinase XerD
MTTTPVFAALVATAPMFSNAERLVLAGFMAGYSGLTRQAYELDLRQFASWCQQHHLRLFQARRADIEFFGRDLQARGRARATVTRRLCTVAGFYKYAGLAYISRCRISRCRPVGSRRGAVPEEGRAPAP